MFGLEKSEVDALKKLNTPKKIQDFLNCLEINFEEDGIDTCMSPRMILKTGKCHCIEGAILAALAFRVNGIRPLIVDMTSNNKDFDHVIAVFKKDGKWGAVSKTNHAVLRYRDPIYKNIRELVMSFFNEYFDDNGKKTLRSYSMPVDLSKFDKKGWMTGEKDLWYIADHLCKVKHYPMLNRKQIMNLRNADKIEIDAGKLLEWQKPEGVKNHALKHMACSDS